MIFICKRCGDYIWTDENKGNGIPRKHSIVGKSVGSHVIAFREWQCTGVIKKKSKTCTNCKHVYELVKSSYY